MNLDKVYICHWNKLVDRKKWMIEHLSDRGIFNYEWVEDYDKDNWNVDEIKSEYPFIFEISRRAGY
jgi:hypothetical protein